MGVSAGFERHITPDREFPVRRDVPLERAQVVGDLRVVVFFAGAFFVVVLDFEAADFDAVDLVLVDFDAVDFEAADFEDGDRVVVFFGAGPFARFSASSSAARSSVRVSTSSPLRSEALYPVPSVT